MQRKRLDRPSLSSSVVDKMVKNGPKTNGRRFRSDGGCCICAKKSQPSRPFFFARDPHELREVFGMHGRTGDICSACHSKVVHHRKQTKVINIHCNITTKSIVLFVATVLIHLFYKEKHPRIHVLFTRNER